MTRIPRAVAGALLVPAFWALPVLAPDADAKTISPFRAELTIRWGEGAGSDEFLDELARAAAENLATACFSGVVVTEREAKPSDTELVLALVLSDAFEETRFDDSIATALQPDDPSRELRRVARFEVRVDAVLTARVTGAVAYRKHFVASAERRPQYVGDDAPAGARADAIHGAVRELTTSLGCGGEKLQKKIRAALAESGGKTP
jgi:hypothetical protein